jgi:dGTPase
MREQATEMKRFLFKNLYRHPQVSAMTKNAGEMIGSLFHYYEKHPTDLPFDFRPDDEIYRRISHYIAGMTDRYANKEFQKLIA